MLWKARPVQGKQRCDFLDRFWMVEPLNVAINLHADGDTRVIEDMHQSLMHLIGHTSLTQNVRGPDPAQ